MAWVAPVVSAVVQAGAAGASAAQAGKGGGGGINTQQVPLPSDMRALQTYTNRLLALNATTKRPTFLDYMASGGQARYDLKDPGLTPIEARGLGMVDLHGREIPYFNPETQTQLTPAQALYMGRIDAKNKKNTRPAKLWKTFAKYTHTRNKAGRGNVMAERRLPRIQARLEDFIERINTLGLGAVDEPDIELNQFPTNRRDFGG